MMRYIGLMAARSLLKLMDKFSREQSPKIDLGQQHLSHCRVLANREALLHQMPKGGAIAELGVDSGIFSQQILEICKPSKLYLIDTFTNESKLIQVKARFQAEIATGSVILLKAMSLEAAARIPDNSLSCVYVDTDHSYLTTKHELEAYSSKLQPDGILAGHDYTQGNWANRVRYGVIEAVHEFCVNHNWEMVFITLEAASHRSFAIRKRTNNP